MHHREHQDSRTEVFVLLQAPVASACRISSHAGYENSKVNENIQERVQNELERQLLLDIVAFGIGFDFKPSP